MHSPLDLPALVATTQSFTLGLQRSFTFTPCGVLYLQSTHGEDPVQDLWCLPITEDGFGSPFCVVNAHEVDPGDISAEEAARRERVRERAQGIVTFTVSDDGTRCAFPWGEGIGVVNPFTTEWVATLTPPGLLAHPTISPDGRFVAGVIDGAVWVISVEDGHARCLVTEPGPVTWGVADFIAAEEMGRTVGLWWRADSTAVLAARVDNTALTNWWISAPADPTATATPMAYPPTGGVNATISLAVITLDGQRTDLPISFGPGHEDEYLVGAQWITPSQVVVTGQTRNQQRVRSLVVDMEHLEASVVDETVQSPYVELIAGLPKAVQTDSGLIHVFSTGIIDNQRNIVLNQMPFAQDQKDWTVTQVVHLCTKGRWRIIANGIPNDKPWTNEGRLLSDDTVQRFAGTLWAGHAGPEGETVVVQRLASFDHDPMIKVILIDRTGQPMIMLQSLATPFPTTGVHVYGPLVGDPGIRTLVFVDKHWKPKDGPCPVLVKSYGGPHARMVVDDRSRFAEAAYFAQQGFCVVVTDGLGAPGGGVNNEYAIVQNLEATVTSQVHALDLIDHHLPGLLDRTRVAIMGWSYGGYLAARAVLAFPHIFSAGLAGAPVTDWRLYDTHYTERYLGDPNEDPAAYDREDLAAIASTISPDEWPGRLLLIHGLADDNVVVAHTLRLSAAMLAMGLPHEVLPVSNVTHFTSSVTINTNLLRHQRDFLRRYIA